VAGGREDQAEADEGDEAEAEADPGSPVREVTMDELDRGAARVVRTVRAGEVAVITKHGRPVAMILSVPLAADALPPEVLGSRWRELEAAFARREWRRSISALLHARWY
jgi:prevent-host-death family protein